MYPIKFKPWLKAMVWGGEKIAPYKGISIKDKNIGESWELSGVEGHLSVATNEPFTGKTIKELIKEYKGRLVGEKVYAENGEQFPLLIKFIDAQSDLSIQVHPDDAMAERKYGKGAKGKTEMWYVIDAEPGAFLLSGLSKEISQDEYVSLVNENKITDVLVKHSINAGDVFFLPAGRIHAIGAGAFIAEIQQTSDITYRIYDYGRLGLDGKPRELHTELAKEAIDYKVYPEYKTIYKEKKDAENEVVSCPFFTTSIFDLDKATEKDLSGLDSFVVVVCISGGGRIIDYEPSDCGCSINEETVTIKQGETILIPASSKKIAFIPDKAMKVITSHL